MTKIKEQKKTPRGLFKRCPKCDYLVYSKELEENLWVCPKCSYYFRLDSSRRLELLIDKDSFEEFDSNLTATDPLEFTDRISYASRLDKYKDKTNLSEAVISGRAAIGGNRIIICILDFSFMGGSMGAVVGEKICRAIDRAIETRVPLIMVSSSGGARMQEGIISLMQMAKTSAAISRLSEERIPYFSLMCDPTSGGVSASYAMLGDVNMAEPGALIAFAGPRVIKQTINEELPPGFQRAEFLLEHGMLDMVVERENLRDTLNRLILLFNGKKDGSK
ncbi:MAG: acetyl-CoA carboxylase, carboxyltransferase subunit beta [Elusimicrobiota bacterium]|nr:acetyl-CoA carboxylase, carboxyltransferase subunit beta [Elusimicrobiota bacterium]